MKLALGTILFISLAAVLTACKPGNKLADLSDFDLETKYAYCLDHEPTAPGKATGCENLRKECELRASNGNFVCRKY